MVARLLLTVALGFVFLRATAATHRTIWSSEPVTDDDDPVDRALVWILSGLVGAFAVLLAFGAIAVAQWVVTG